ncbi:MAG: hypothetical protein VKM34_05960 [Cyanobacteriota bacterium]|nr:hypothetical protein [Cyanobacteriota bacterium]
MVVNQVSAFSTGIGRPGAVAIEVSDARGRWWSGYWILTFDADGLVTVLSAATGAIQRLPQDRWRDPAEEMLLASGITKEPFPSLGYRNVTAVEAEALSRSNDMEWEYAKQRADAILNAAFSGR